MLPRPIRSEMSKATERCDSLPGCNYAIWQDSEEFCFTTDAVFLAAFPHLVRQARVLELGAGTGAISLLLAARGAAQVVGVDCNPHVVELMRRSIAANGLEECVSAELADLRELKALYRSESFDLIAANPPYRNSGKVRRVATAACHELTATLEDFFRAAAYLVKYRGRFAIVQLPERFTECMELALKYGCNPNQKPSRIYMEEGELPIKVLSGKPGYINFLDAYGLEVLPPLIMYNEDGSHSKQTLEYYGMAEEAE